MTILRTLDVDIKNKLKEVVPVTNKNNVKMSLLLMLLAVALLIGPPSAMGAHEQDIADLQQKVKALEAAQAAKAQDGKAVDFGGFIRTRMHLSNFTTYSSNGDFQTLPFDRSVKDANNSANYFEQRARLYITPKLNDYLSGTFAFEIDFRAGDSAYAVGRNSGGGLEADQTNFETKNLFITAKVPGTNLTTILGLQNLKDAYNGILLGWADATGATLNYKAANNVSTVLGWYRFWQPASRLKKSVAADFWRGEVAYSPTKDLDLGFNLYALSDRSGAGASGSDTGALGGPAIGSSSNGYAPLAYNASTGHESLVGDTDYTMTLWYPGINFSYRVGGYTIDGFGIYQLGQFRSASAGIDNVNIRSGAANLNVSTKIGPASVKLGGLYVSGSDSKENPSIGIKKGGFYTPGSYSLAAAWMGLTGMKIIFPDIDATNQDQYLVYDASNILEQRPLGVQAIMLTGNVPLSKKTNLELGLGTASAAEKRVVNDKKYMATEVNAGVHHALYKNMSIGLVGAYAWVGNLYKVTDAQAATYNASAPGLDVRPNRDPADMWRVYLRANYSF